MQIAHYLSKTQKETKNKQIKNYILLNHDFDDFANMTTTFSCWMLKGGI